MRLRYIYIYLILIVLSCTKKELATVKTNPDYIVTNNSAKIAGLITNDGGSSIVSKGICLSSKETPTILDTVLLDSTVKLQYEVEFDELSPNKTYFVRAFVKNKNGLSYGDVIRISTNQSIITKPVTNITSSSAISGCIASNYSLNNQTDTYGLCWSKHEKPTIKDFVSHEYTYGYTFDREINGLDSNTIYYVRAYISDSKGVSYGNQIEFKTKSNNSPTVKTGGYQNLNLTSVSCDGEVLFDCNSSVSEKGIIYGTNENLTILNNHLQSGSVYGSVVFSSVLINLAPSTKYYYRAYAKNGYGVGYGDVNTFTTNKTKPTVVTDSVSSIGTTSITATGTVKNDGGDVVTSRGFCWGTSNSPTIANNTTNNGFYLGSFSANIQGLTPNTTYYIRSYATNSTGTSYGNQIVFTTLNIYLPSVSTNSINSITNTSVTCNGVVSSDGNSQVLSRGFCWSSTNSLPSLNDNSLANGSGLGTFISQISGLTLNTVYYIRAFASNSKGTQYGQVLKFTTTISVGDSYQGGKVAYILQSGDPGYISGENHGLIAAPTDQSSSIYWHVSNDPLIGATASSIGSGNSNTIKIVNKYGYEQNAARICYDLYLGGYSDWYLPSKDELAKLYLNRVLIGGFSTYYYHSSTEEEARYNWIHYFSDGTNRTYYKTFKIYVRAIRSF